MSRIVTLPDAPLFQSGADCSCLTASAVLPNCLRAGRPVRMLCTTVKLSLREHCPWVTADERIANALGATLPQIIWVANWS